MEQAKPPDTVRITRRAIWIIAVLAAALLVAAVTVIVIQHRKPGLNLLDLAAFEKARDHWDHTSPQNYNIEVQVSGRQPATYMVEVRAGEVQDAFRNGLPLKQHRTFGTWSVPGMFETIETDLLHVEKVRQGKVEQSTPELTLHARFDPQYGYPASYLRLEHGRMGTNPVVTWEVVRFEALPNE